MKQCECTLGDDGTVNDSRMCAVHAKFLDDAIAFEREEIAKMIETWPDCRYVEHVQELCECRPMAAAIRARGKQEG